MKPCDVKIYSIWGISFCGSTLLSYCLGKSPDLFSVGESHWLKNDINKAICKIHGVNCNFWDKNFRKNIDNRRNPYPMIRNKAFHEYNIKALLLSDKNADIYETIMAPKGYERIDKAILLCKNPYNHLASVLRKPNKSMGFSKDMTKIELVKKSLYKYKVHYKKAYGLLILKDIPFMIIDFDNFTNDPNFWLYRMCQFLDIKYTNDMSKYWKLNDKSHQLGGNRLVSCNFDSEPMKDVFLDLQYNSKAQEWYRKAQRHIKTDNRWIKELTNEQKIIVSQSDALKTFKLFKKSAGEVIN